MQDDIREEDYIEEFFEDLAKDAAILKNDPLAMNPPYGEHNTEEFQNYERASYRFTKKSEILQYQMFGKMDQEAMYKSIGIFVGPEAEAKARNGFMDTAVFVDYDKLDPIRRDASLSQEQKIQKFQAHIKENNLEGQVNKKIQVALYKTIKEILTTEEGVRNFYKKAKEANFDFKSFIPKEKIYAPTEPGFPGDVHFREKDINAIIETLDPEKDAADIEVLKHSNEILTDADTNITDVTMKSSENYGKYVERIRVDEIYKQMDAELKNYKDYLPYDAYSLHIDPTKESFREDFKNMNMQMTTDAAARAGIMDIVRQMDEHNMIPQGGESEQGAKKYAMSPIFNKKNEISKAVTAHDLAALGKLNKEYDELTEVYDKLLSEVKELGDKKQMPANVSSSREGKCPAKYRADFLGVSRLSGLYQSKMYCTEYGIDFEEFIKNPPEAIMNRARERYLDNDVNRYLQEHSIGELMSSLTVTNDEFVALQQKEYKFADSMRASDGIIALLPAEEQAKVGAKARMVERLLTGNGACTTNPFGYLEETKSLMESLIIMEPKDRNYLLMNSFAKDVINPITMEREKMPDLNTYIEQGKTTLDAVKGRLAETFAAIDKANDKQKDVRSVVRSMAENIIKLDPAMPESERQAFEIFVKETPTNAEKLVAIARCQNGIAQRKGDPTAENFQHAIKGVSELQNKYNKKFFLSRWFGSEGRYLRSNINQLMSDFRKMGIPETDLQASLKGFREGKPVTFTKEEKAPEKAPEPVQEKVVSAPQRVALSVDLETESIMNQRTNEVIEKGTAAPAKTEETVTFENDAEENSKSLDDLQSTM